MIILATCRHEETGDVIVSHGIEYNTLKNVCLPCEPLNYFIRHCGAVRMDSIGEWVLFDKDEHKEDFEYKVDNYEPPIKVIYRD